jgi:hypothetical protein
MTKWQRLDHYDGGYNEFITVEDGTFSVSFNPQPSPNLEMFQSDDGGPETALIKDNRYFILNGDFRESYEKLIPLGFERCKEFYDQQAAHANSSWTTRR